MKISVPKAIGTFLFDLVAKQKLTALTDPTDGSDPVRVGIRIWEDAVMVYVGKTVCTFEHSPKAKEGIELGLIRAYITDTSLPPADSGIHSVSFYTTDDPDTPKYTMEFTNIDNVACMRFLHKDVPDVYIPLPVI